MVAGEDASGPLPVGGRVLVDAVIPTDRAVPHVSDARHYETTVDVRYSDLDAFGHLNNAVYVTLCEEARVDFVRDVLGVDAGAVGFVVAHQEIDYARPVTDVGPLTVVVEVADVGDTSWTVTYDVRDESETVATAETVLVFVDEAGRPREIPDAWRAAIDDGGDDGSGDAS